MRLVDCHGENLSARMDSRTQRMHVFVFRAAIFASAFAILISPTRAVNYTATLLHPDGFINTNGSGVSNASQVGSGHHAGFNGFHALLWTGSAANFVDLHPANFTSSFAVSATDTNQVGFGSATGGHDHALLWSGTAGSAVDLHPADSDTSYAYDVSGSNQVGYGSTNFVEHAFLWNGTAASKVDLNPAGFTGSYALGVSGSQQVGYGHGSTTSGNVHALLWSGTATSKVDLHPVGFTTSIATDIYSGTISTQVGYGEKPVVTHGETHALLWTGTAASVVDLHPAGYLYSQAYGVSVAGQVGTGIAQSSSNPHALYWNGTAESVIDLHTILLADTGHAFIYSEALGIADNGTIVGTAVDGFNNYAILWTPTSESGVDGDYNNNGTVDADDYVAWRKGSTHLHNEVATMGSNTPGDYTEWRARFGNPPGSGASLNSASA